MSTQFSWQAAVTKSGLEATTKLVLLVIGTYMNQHGDGAFPSYKTIAADASLNRATVIRHVETAVAQGWLQKRNRVRLNGASGRLEADSNTYLISFPVVAQDDQGGRTEQPPLVAENDHPSRTGRPPLVAQGDPNTPSLTPQLTTPLPPGDEVGAQRRSKASKGDVESDHFRRFYEAYPRKIDRQGAAKAWARHGCDALVEQITADVKARVAEDPGWAKDKARFIPHPATYLNGHRWEDQWRTGGAGSSPDADLPSWLQGAI